MCLKDSILSIPSDYVERVYAGVLGKLIGVYLGRPFEGWTYERIMAELGEIDGYVNERLRVPLVVTDDDISGTFTFLRALPDHGNPQDLTPAQIGETWLNYIVERRTILWWGGMGESTEHTAYLRLKHGIPAPRSGSMALNGKAVAEQIGSQIFIDGWAMVAPGDPELAADLARRAASVSHDGEAIYGAQALAAMEAQAFVERDIGRLLDTALSVVPADSLIARVIGDIRAWHAAELDWRAVRSLIDDRYGYDTYGGNCHMIPNHALIILGLLYGEGDLARSLRIVNTAGWDTDCNSGNLGCLLGIRGGLATFEGAYDWRGPVADRLYLPTADGGRAITDAVTETYHIVNIARSLAGEAPLAPKDGARFHFELPGSVQGFQAEDGALVVENIAGHSRLGPRSLALRYRAGGSAARVTTPTFVPPQMRQVQHYSLLASPSVYPGQTVRAALSADAGNKERVSCLLFIRSYGPDDDLRITNGPEVSLAPGAEETVEWILPQLAGAPIAQLGVEVLPSGSAGGAVYLDYLAWDGTPNMTFRRPPFEGTMWRRAWVDATDHFGDRWPEAFRISQDEGRGLLITGTREWTDCQVAATITPHLAAAWGLAARVQGLRRYYALLLRHDDKLQLVRVLEGETVLAETGFPWSYDCAYTLRLQVEGDRIRAWVDGELALEARDGALGGGGIALVCEEGRIATEEVMIGPPA